MGIVFDESISMRAEMDYQATTMILENKRMKDQLAVYAVVEEQNKVLKEEVSRVHDDMKSKDLRHREEMENLKVPLSFMAISFLTLRGRRVWLNTRSNCKKNSDNDCKMSLGNCLRR